MKKLLFVGLMLALTVGVVEAMARLTHRLTFGEYVAPTLPTNDDRSFARDEPVFALHPYLGLVFSDRRHSLNVKPAPRRQEDALVIALLGGSVANDIAGYLRSALFNALMFGMFGMFDMAGKPGSHEATAGIAPVFLNLATDSFRQPQQALTVANLLADGAEFDILIVLDGINELEQVNVALAKSLAPATPFYWWPMARSHSAEELTPPSPLQNLEDRRHRLLQAEPWQRLLYRSAVFGLFRRLSLERIEQDRQQLLNRQLAMAGLGSQGPQETGRGQASAAVDRSQRARAGAEYWQRGAVLLAALAERHGAAHYHFLQPSQYVPGAKPLSAEERANAFRPDRGTAPIVREAYPQLARFGQHLRRQGVKFFDLSRIYADIPETLYIDWCCHLNERGNRLLADRILRRVVEDARVVERLRGRGGEVPLVPLASDVFDIYRVGNYLAYTKAPCTTEDTAAPFFLHLTQVEEEADEDDRPSDVSPSRSPSSRAFDNLDFAFEDSGSTFGDRCTATVPLPGYPAASVSTGQFGDGEQIWAVAFRTAADG